jgi:hypothetical protein
MSMKVTDQLTSDLAKEVARNWLDAEAMEGRD